MKEWKRKRNNQRGCGKGMRLRCRVQRCTGSQRQAPYKYWTIFWNCSKRTQTLQLSTQLNNLGAHCTLFSVFTFSLFCELKSSSFFTCWTHSVHIFYLVLRFRHFVLFTSVLFGPLLGSLSPPVQLYNACNPLSSSFTPTWTHTTFQSTPAPCAPSF